MGCNQGGEQHTSQCSPERASQPQGVKHARSSEDHEHLSTYDLRAQINDTTEEDSSRSSPSKRRRPNSVSQKRKPRGKVLQKVQDQTGLKWNETAHENQQADDDEIRTMDKARKKRQPRRLPTNELITASRRHANSNAEELGSKYILFLRSPREYTLTVPPFFSRTIRIITGSDISKNERY